MGSCAVPSLDQILAAIQAIYDAALDEAAWPRALEQVAELLGSSGGGVIFPDGPGDAPPAHLVRLAPEAWAAYAQHYRLIDPITSFVQRAAPGVYTDRMAVPRPELLRSAMHNEFCLPNDTSSLMMGSSRQPGASTLLILGRSARAEEFDDEERALLGLLLPHLAAAARVRAHLAAATLRAHAATEALDRVAQSVLMVTAHSSVVYANRAGERLLRQADGLSVDANGLRAARSADTAALRRLVLSMAAGPAKTSSGGTLQIERSSERRPLSVTVAPVARRVEADWLPTAPAVAIVLVSEPGAGDQPARARHFRATFGLTEVEGAVARLIANGNGVKPAARLLRVAPSTVRTHLHRVFAKTATQRQSELAALWGQLGGLDLEEDSPG